MKRVIILSVVLIAGLNSCNYFGGKRIRGNGNVISQQREHSGFTAVDVSSAIHLYVKQDSVFSVKVETDENLQEYVRIGTDDGTLYIREEDNTNLDATGKINVYVSAPAFQHLEASGASEIHGENMLTSDKTITLLVTGASGAELHLKAPAVSGEMTGASKLRLSGQTKDLSIEGTGASHARCFDLLSENATVDLSGASDAEIFASVKLDADASGASGVKYKGEPAVTQRVSGAASVRKAE